MTGVVRFYRGWWQNVPSEYRPYITIAGKKTCEYDFSQLNPHMVYFLQDKELGSEDAYDRVFGCDHRDLVKEAFNAMMQSSTPLVKEPEYIDLSEVDFDWPFLRQAILMLTNPSKICSLRDMETTFNTSTVLWQRRLC